MKKYLSVFSAVALLMSTTACESFFDINTDPNAPAVENITSSMIFPAAEMAAAVSYGDYLRIVGGYYSQVYAHQFGTSNYLDYSQFEMSATRSSGTYSQLYQKGLTNLKTVQEKSVETEDWGTFLAATTVRAFIFQALVDCYGEVPYSEALDDSNLTPKYDDGKDIYLGILDEIDAALEKVSPSDLVCTSFIFPGKNASEWIKFANSLKLRILVRMMDNVDVKSRLDALVAENNFITSDVEVAGCWEQAAGKESPFYGEEFSTLGGSTQVNVIANAAIINSMQVRNSEGDIVYTDPRLAAFFAKNNEGKYEGGVSGTNFSTAASPYNSTGHWCRPVASYDMPVSLLSLAEVKFFLAEYAAKYNAGNAAAYYEEAIEASFASAGVDGAAEYIALNPFKASNYKESIGIAKWIALSGVNPFEAYCELRRLKYPQFITDVKGTDLYKDGGKAETTKLPAYRLYTPIMAFGQVGDNALLQRFPYAESSDSRNTNCPEFPGYTTPIFWAK